MAKLHKDRARKPIMPDAAAVPSMTWDDRKPFYRIDLFHSSDPSYHVLLTRAEMLGVVAEWLKIESRLVADEIKRKERADAAFSSEPSAKEKP